MKIVTVGNGMVGQEFLRLAVSSNTNNFELTVFGEERHPAYDRVALSSYIDDADPRKLALAPEDFFSKHGIQVALGDPIVSIDRSRREVTSRAGRVEQYDALVLATGARPFVPRIAGTDFTGVFVYRTLDDLDAIREYAKSCRVGIVLGGGLLGLECANALKKLQLDTRVLELSQHLMPAQIDSEAGALVQSMLEAQGYAVSTNVVTRSVLERDGRVVGLDTSAGRIDCDILVISAGIVPEDSLARKAGLTVGGRGGVIIDADCRSSDPDIFAIGECACFEGNVYGLVAPGYQMAKAAVAALSGESRPFVHRPLASKLKLAGVNVASIGTPAPQGSRVRAWFIRDGSDQRYAKVVVGADDAKLRQCILVGDVQAYDTLFEYHSNGLAVPDAAIAASLAGAPLEGARQELPDEAILCSCKSLSRGELRQAILRDKLHRVPLLKRATGAGLGCGGCVPSLTALLKQVLVKQGAGGDSVLCEHFPYSRAKLFELIARAKVGSFDDALKEVGTGVGCEVCQPAVASILAVTSPHHVIGREHVASQDFNDRFLGNVQRDGTYSIIPRLPGGEVTASQLATLAQIADDFQLYLRVTGGQRIGFFGARIEELPKVWARLTQAGFESGHTYGKALRTIKTCVGSNWCAWAVQDSTTLAIKLEERYKGLRSPHKTKAGVSGCVRDCAEAKIKDFGLVATDKGWNLIIAGNGGRDAATGKLLAQDVDEDTAIRYLDRLLMYYIRTADHLSRTITWLEGLQGGIEHLRDVVVKDKLGIAESLEQDMQRVVNDATCEWSRALADKDVLSRFRHYVNSSGSDPTVVHFSLRGQNRAATPEERRRLQKPLLSPSSLVWVDVIAESTLIPNLGVNALVQGEDVAVFRLRSGELCAVDNIDPVVYSSVLSRGVVGERNGKPFVISPISRKTFCLLTGECLDDSSYRISTHSVRVHSGRVQVRLTPQEARSRPEPNVVSDEALAVSSVAAATVPRSQPNATAQA